MKKIDVEFLHHVWNRIIEKLKDENLVSIGIKGDLYRIIPTDEWEITNRKDLKDIVVIGSLFDDIESLEQLIADPERPCTYVDFDRLASVLRAISEIRNPVVN